MPSPTRLFVDGALNKWTINVLIEAGKVLFDAEDVSAAVGYAKISSLDHHAASSYKIRNGKKFLTLNAVKRVAKAATRTRKFRDFADWAWQVQKAEAKMEEAAVQVAKQKKPVADAWPYPPTKVPQRFFGVSEASFNLGMSVAELSDWLVAEGYASRYTSNGALRWNKWFKSQGYGALRILDDEKGKRDSNVPRITQSGLEFIKNRLESKRESGVLAFATATATVRDKTERVKLESEANEIIKKAFAPYIHNSDYAKAFLNEPEYRMTMTQILKKVKEIVAQTKLKDQ